MRIGEGIIREHLVYKARHRTIVEVGPGYWRVTGSEEGVLRTVTEDQYGDFECDCEAGVMRNDPGPCTHMIAVWHHLGDRNTRLAWIRSVKAGRIVPGGDRGRFSPTYDPYSVEARGAPIPRSGPRRMRKAGRAEESEGRANED